MKTIVDVFDPHSTEHMEAYKHLQKTGFWPKEFVKKFKNEIYNSNNLWQIEILAKIANEWIKHFDNLRENGYT